MKILVYSSVFYPNVGGIENLALVLIEQFMAAGHEVKVITEQKQDPSKPKLPFDIVESNNKLAQIRLFFWCDFVFMPNITLKGVWLFALNPFKKLIISHNDFHLAYHKKWWADVKMKVIKRAFKNISVSQSLADFLKIPCTVIHNCYNNNIFKLYTEEKRDNDFVFVGRLVSSKGCLLLVEAFSRLKGNYTLNIIGDGPEMSNIKTLVTQHGLEGRVIFSGFMHGEELARALNRHKVMVVPPIGVEGFGIVALEGLACGCEMIVSKAGGLPEAVADYGLIFEMNDVEALVNCMQIAIEKPDKNIISPQKKAFLEEHYKERVAQKYLEVFSTINK